MSALDGTRTTVDWQMSPTRIAVLPVGAHEQHGGRLPLCTDTLLAEHFARHLAESLEAALLPALPFATSLEHSAFRGSISLRPETAMALLRDLAESLERQGFRRLVVVNGHGGNFFLGPVARDLNATERPIRLLVVDCGARFDDSEAGRLVSGGELHAGASENSRLMAIRPDLVGPPERALAQGGGHGDAFERSDMNSFGIDHHDPSGVWGDPTGGDPATGAAMVASIERNLLAHVRQRLEWMDAHPRYTGRGGIALRPLGPDDIADGLRLCRAAGWNQERADWELFLALRPEGCFAAVRQGTVIGTVTTLAFGGRGWIGMVLVDPDHRRLGIGTRLLEAAMASLQDCACIKLDATSAGKRVYDGLGFVDESTVHRLVRPPGPSAAVDAHPGLRPMAEADLDAVAALDTAAAGVERTELVRHLHRAHPAMARVIEREGRVVAAALGRPGATFDQVGPVLAAEPADAAALVAAAIGDGRRSVGIDAVPREDWLKTLAAAGFLEQRCFTRMRRGTDPAPERHAGRYAIAGPELG